MATQDDERKYPCPCCGSSGQMIEEKASFCICHVCGWEDDGLYDYQDNVNQMTLEQAKKLWAAGEPIWKKNKPNLEAFNRIIGNAP